LPSLGSGLKTGYEMAAKYIYDPLLGRGVYHDHGTGGFPADGGVLTGDLEFPLSGYIMNSDTKRWRITMNDEGAFVSTDISTNAGKMMGLLCLTYAE
jgi:hypothetical protein